MTQNTNWQNVTYSLENLKAETAFNPQALLDLDQDRLEAFIRPSGFYSSKARSLKVVFDWYSQYGFDPKRVNKSLSIDRDLRKELLSPYGIGSETANVLLLYIFDRVSFVADTYARRLFSSLSDQDFKTYQGLYSLIDLKKDLNLLEAQEFHGVIVEFGKVYLRKNQSKEENFLSGYRIII